MSQCIQSQLCTFLYGFKIQTNSFFCSLLGQRWGIYNFQSHPITLIYRFGEFQLVKHILIEYYWSYAVAEREYFFGVQAIHILLGLKILRTNILEF